MSFTSALSPLLRAMGAAVLISMATLAAPKEAKAQSVGFVFAGAKTVNYGFDGDVLRFPGPIFYRAIQLCARHAPVRLDLVRVVFANAGRQRFAVRLVLEPGACTRPLLLRGGPRNIRRVVMLYGEPFGGPTPVVEVYAAR